MGKSLISTAPPTSRGIAFRFRHCCASSERREHRPLCRQHRFSAGAGVFTGASAADPVFDKLSPEQQQALSDTVKDTLQLLVDADKRIYGDVTGKTLEAIAAQGYSYKGGQLEKQQPEATPESLMTGETVRTPRGNFYITDMSREQIEAAGFGFHHASEDGKYLIMGNGTQAYAIAAEQPQRDNPLKHVEDIVEQNDNNFDGIINNTPQTPTVADLEQRAKAGEAISVTRPCGSGKSRETGAAAKETVHFEEAGRVQETGGAAAERQAERAEKGFGGLIV